MQWLAKQVREIISPIKQWNLKSLIRIWIKLAKRIKNYLKGVDKEPDRDHDLPCTLFSSRNRDLKEHCGSQHNLNVLWYTKSLEMNV